MCVPCYRLLCSDINSICTSFLFLFIFGARFKCVCSRFKCLQCSHQMSFIFFLNTDNDDDIEFSVVRFLKPRFRWFFSCFLFGREGRWKGSWKRSELAFYVDYGLRETPHSCFLSWFLNDKRSFLGLKTFFSVLTFLSYDKVYFFHRNTLTTR